SQRSLVAMAAPLLILLLSFVLGSAAQYAQGDESLEIIDGVPCPRGSQPWQVALHKGSQPHCGGVLLSRQWVLTTAHWKMNEYNLHMHSDQLVPCKAWCHGEVSLVAHAVSQVSIPKSASLLIG
uniref:Peptidase S1 domain-containing protein n=1 Tax=Bos indicus x Bos taurus TaxID=30522 RepID=A0A4W2FW60_BOBOX